MNTAKEILKGRIATLKRQKWDAEYRQKELAVLPAKVKETEEKLALLKSQLAELPATTNEDVIDAKKRKNELEKQLPKKEKGKDFPPEFAETLTALQEATDELKKKQKEAKAYSNKLDDIEVNEGNLATYKADLVSYEFLKDGDTELLSTVSAKIEEAEACLNALDEEVTWPMMLAKVAVRCELEWKKKGKYDFCLDCPFYNKKKGCCSIQGEFNSRPAHWHLDEMQFNLEKAWGDGV